MIVTSWRPKKRAVYYQEKPDWVPSWVYTEAVTAKRFYNENWEFWVWNEAQYYNKPIPETEDACIRGLKKVFDQVEFTYSKLLGPTEGSRIARWYKDFMEMDTLFNKVKHPEYKEIKLDD